MELTRNGSPFSRSDEKKGVFGPNRRSFRNSPKKWVDLVVHSIKRNSGNQIKAMIRCLDINRSATRFLISLSPAKSLKSPSVSLLSRHRTIFSKWIMLQISKSALRNMKFSSRAELSQNRISRHSSTQKLLSRKNSKNRKEINLNMKARLTS